MAKHKNQDRAYVLTPERLAANAGSPVVLLDDRAIGRRFRLFDCYPGSNLNEWIRADGFPGSPSDPNEFHQSAENDPGESKALDPTDPLGGLTVVSVRGVLEQRATKHDSGCGGGYCDGHDAVADRLCAALAVGDVLFDVDSPGGAHAGLRENIRRVLEAKKQFGRRITGFANELIGSAAYWWTASICDAIFTPPDGQIGSVGARSAHQSVAGALKKAGVAVTYFCWPDAGKVAFAPELPLSEEGIMRGNRDVAIAGKAFAKAVSRARGISFDEIVALKADALTGQSAVDAGLADGVASFGETLNYALSLVASGGDASMGTTYEKKTTERYEEDDEPTQADDAGETKGDEDDVPPEAPDAPKGDEEEDKKADDADEDEEEDDHPPLPNRMTGRSGSPRRADSRPLPSLQELAGVRKGASMPATISALAPMVSLARDVLRVTNTSTASEAKGALQALVEDASRCAEYETKLRAQQRKAARQERWTLCRALVSAQIPGHERGRVFVDEVDDSGARTMRLSPVYAEMKLGTLRGLVSGLTSKRDPLKTPFNPDASVISNATPSTKETIELAQATGFNPADIAASRRALFGA